MGLREPHAALHWVKCSSHKNFSFISFPELFVCASVQIVQASLYFEGVVAVVEIQRSCI